MLFQVLDAPILAPNRCPPRDPSSPPLWPLPPPPSGAQPGRLLSMIAQPVARILICIPRRPARPGHQPTFGPDSGRPASAPGRMLKTMV